jgi:hypothetical protein
LKHKADCREKYLSGDALERVAPDAQLAGNDNFRMVFAEDAGESMEERALARPCRTDDPNATPLRDLKGN